MIDFQQKRKIKKVFYSRFILASLFILVFFVGLQVYNIFEKQRLSKDSLLSVYEEYEGLVKRERMLISEIERLKTKDGIEEEIRNKFDVARPGEHVVVVVDSGSNSSGVDLEKNTGWLESFLNWFK